MENWAVYIGLGVLALALLCGYGDMQAGTNDYGAGFGSFVNGIAAIGAVVGIGYMAVLAIKGFKSNW